ncbi:uncharacterized protein F5Z01DRAFT_312079 [Emericellopsis atlantica]|uniref:Uncharacterized protein n=1 Tax=Emericellopsis atlantica TaxID=2614577 RepID=A0A9P8CSD5_9HYPO|nr:uncharacterized protein F5Z01DRAFT_312079 [Emericellopsis atlantica]KAG9257969.1 hypothetical protein F5Z01DRAFT_312079 [Emericellopsis atlantica]
MPIRNPFTRRGQVTANDDSLRPEAPGFERIDTHGSKASSVLSVRSSKSQDNGEYKMSVVNDSGVYLPPSPTEEKGQWPRQYLSTRKSTDTRSSFGDIEHFSISRESFDSYRRSFDVTARSPITHDVPNRSSLDSARYPRLPRSAIDRQKERQASMVEESFEEVGLDDQKQQAQAQQARKRGFFSKFGDTQDKDATAQGPVARFLHTGRKRGQSGQGAELGSIEQPKVLVTQDARD